MAKTIGFVGWAAGIIDGEGCIHIHKTDTEKRRSYYLGVNVATTTQRMVELLKEEWFGSITYYPTGQGGSSKQPSWLWRLTGKAALSFLQDILPYVEVKKDQVACAIDYQATMLKRDGRFISPELQEFQETMYQKLRSLHLSYKDHNSKF